MKFYEQKFETKEAHSDIVMGESFTYTVEDVFGTIVITSKNKLKAEELDTITVGIMQSGFSKGVINEAISFTWDKKSEWLKEDDGAKPIDDVSPKSRFVALVWCICLGGFGAHRFYIGRWKSGLTILLLTISIVGIFASGVLVIADFIFIASGKMHDANDRRLSKW